MLNYFCNRKHRRQLTEVIIVFSVSHVNHSHIGSWRPEPDAMTSTKLENVTECKFDT